MKNEIIPEVYLPNSLIKMCDLMPEPCGIRNLESRFIYANSSLMKVYGVNSSADIIGKRDVEIKSKLVEFDNAAEEFAKQDKQVFKTEQRLSTLEFHPLAIDYPYVVNKLPFYNDNNEYVGMFGYIKKLEIYTINDYIKGHMPGSLLLNKPDDFFTERECEIMFFRLRGMKVKAVADRLNLATRTVENYMQELYYKVNVNHFDDFKRFCVERNYHRYLPKRFMHVNHIDFEV
ncbi:LuxR C-terminal-related transcriptional regulator [Sodalis sp. dw_96]|uniref:LuxR C-terminal-related transcriptional regulator n=1 Tax=Sodalis sp. dw_96 TaxID=2719794 RepID=UPI0021076C52|nr:LuxR C-terminal-related transcriptional regulator [Sodalis sp. dw_96]